LSELCTSPNQVIGVVLKAGLYIPAVLIGYVLYILVTFAFFITFKRASSCISYGNSLRLSVSQPGTDLRP